MQNTKNTGKRKSAQLSTTERETLKEFIASKTSLSEAADLLKVPRYVLDWVSVRGQGSPANILKIQKQLQKVAA